MIKTEGFLKVIDNLIAISRARSTLQLAHVETVKTWVMTQEQ